MKIYTKTGDGGETGLVGSNRISKSSTQIESIGSVDELNSLIGVIRSESLDDELDGYFRNIQNALFDIGALLASTPEQQKKYSIEPISEKRIETLESQIDQFQSTLPEIREFILPAGNRPAALTHLARSVCRRAERSVISFREQSDHEMAPTTVTYLNRLSDWLFVAARSINHRSQQPETFWKKQDH